MVAAIARRGRVTYYLSVSFFMRGLRHVFVLRASTGFWLIFLFFGGGGTWSLAGVDLPGGCGA